MFRWREALQRWVLRHTPRQASVTLNQRRIYLLPTPLGNMMLLVALAVWVGALNYAVSLAYVLAFWIAALMLVSVLLAYRQLDGLQMHATPAANVFAGGEAVFHVRLQWDDALPRHLCLGWFGEPVPAQRCRQPGTLDLACPAPRRGQLAMPVLRVWSEAPLGLVRAFSLVRLDGRVWVYPQPLAESRPLPSTRHDGATAQMPPQPGGDDFAGLAPWQAGQGLHSIAWRVYARRGVLAAREFATPQAADGQLRLSWDDYPAAMPPEQRLSHLCWQLLQTREAGAGVSLQLPQQAMQLAAGQTEAGLVALAAFGVRDAG